jgi:hypothetical protein
VIRSLAKDDFTPAKIVAIANASAPEQPSRSRPMRAVLTLC